MANLATEQLPTAASRAPEPRASKYSLITVEWALVGGLVAGALMSAVTDIVERASISGPGWSLSGNGALSVVAVGAVAVLGGGWAAVAARTTWPRRVAVTLVAFLTTLLVAAAWVFSFLLPNPFATLGATTAVPALLAALVGLALPRFAKAGKAVPRAALVAVAVLLVAALALPGVIWSDFYWLVAPLLVYLPLLARAGRAGGWGWLIGACVAVVVGLVIGVLAAMSGLGVG